MESYIISRGKNILNKTAELWTKSFEASLAGKFTRRLSTSYRESFTARLLNRDMIGQSRTYALLQALASKMEARLNLPTQAGNRLRAAVTYGALPALVILAIMAFAFLPPLMALGALGSALLAAVVFYKTEYGVYAAALLLPFTAFKVLFLLSLWTLASLVFHVLTGTKRFRFHLSSMMVPILLYFLIMIYATVTSVSFFSSAGEFLIPLTGLIYLFIIVNVFDRREKLDTFIYCLAIAGFITAGYAIYQYYAGVSILELRKEWVDVTKNPEIRNRAYAVFENPNLLAQYMVLLTPLSIAAFFNAPGRWRQAFFALTAMLFTYCLVLTYSRGGWLAFAAAVTVFALFKSRFALQALPAAGLIAYLFMPKTILQRLSTITSLKDTSNAYRLDTLQSTLSLIKSHWETGVGLGRKAFARVYYTHMINSNVVPHSHNLYLQVISEFGILGLAVFIWLLLAIFRLGFKLYAAGSAYIRNLNAGIMAAVAGFLIHSLVDYFLWYYKLGILIWLLVAIFLVIEKMAKEQHNHERDGYDAA